MKEKKYEWNLGLLYKGPKDPQIEKDMQKIEKACTDFEKKYKGKNFIKNSSSFLESLKDYERLLMESTYKPLWYFHLSKSINTNDTTILSLYAQFDERQRKAFNKVLFFDLELAKMSDSLKNKFLSDSKFTHFHYFLRKIFNKAKYNLSENEEKLFSLLSQPSEGMWYSAQVKLLASKTVEHKGKIISLSEASQLYTGLLNKKERNTLYQKVLTARKSTADMAEAEINAIYTTKKISDERRGYETPYEETLYKYENDRKEIEGLIVTVTKYFRVSQKFFSLHSKLLKDNKLTVADLYAHIGTLKKKYDFEKAVQVVKNAFARFDIKYAELLEGYINKGQVDVFPRASKEGGAFCSGLAQFPVYVFLNHVDDVKSIETLAHEMGHAIHTELSKPLEPLYGEYSIAVAEVASTFFEQFVADELLKELSDKEKIIILHDRINRDIATIFRQIACFNCELELHQTIRSKGKLSKEEMARIMQKHLKSYMGKSVLVTEDDGYIFTSWSHLRYSFYVYTYAYGLLISRSLYEKWKQDHQFKIKIEQFLSAGSSMSPKDIFKKNGIDTSDPSFFESGLKAIEADIKKLEKLAKQQGML